MKKDAESPEQFRNINVRAVKSESPWSNKTENPVRRVKVLCGCIRKAFESRTGWKVSFLDQIGKLMMRHVEYVMNHIQRRSMINLDGTESKVTTFERYYGQSPEYTVAPFGTKVMARLRIVQASAQEGRYGADWYLGTLSYGGQHRTVPEQLQGGRCK